MRFGVVIVQYSDEDEKVLILCALGFDLVVKMRTPVRTTRNRKERTQRRKPREVSSRDSETLSPATLGS